MIFGRFQRDVSKGFKNLLVRYRSASKVFQVVFENLEGFLGDRVGCRCFTEGPMGVLKGSWNHFR